MLTTLVERIPGARGVVFCALDGEFVDLVVRDATLSAYDMKVFGAHMAATLLNLQNYSSERGAGGIVEMRLGCEGGTLLCRALRDGYYVVVLIEKGRTAGPAAFELQHAAAEIASQL